MKFLRNILPIIGVSFGGIGLFIRNCTAQETNNIFNASWCTPSTNTGTFGVTTDVLHCAGCYMLALGGIILVLIALNALTTRYSTNRQTNLA